jgi:hypothetical protein
VGNFNTEQIPGTINYFPYTTKIGNTTDGYTIWEMNWYYSLINTINQTFPLSKLKLISVDLPSTTATEEVFNRDTQTTTYQQTLKYVSGTPQNKDEFSFIPVNDTQFTVEFTTPANFDFNSNNSFSLLWNNGLPNDALNIW